ncbi:hypothetical protein ZWY2020_023572 [Hordeum vulgare]|nr:hypothetical protein ZWY2020_023572 [Hordeum vulgare]
MPGYPWAHRACPCRCRRLDRRRRGRSTVTYDAGTSEVIQGPPLSPKHQPVLDLARGHALRHLVPAPASRTASPSINPYPTEKESFAYWEELPPFFPCKLIPIEFRNPSEVCTMVVNMVFYQEDRSIFLRPCLMRREKGPYVFHVAKKTWERVDGSNLPFIGQAAPRCNRMFAACTKTNSNNDIDAITIFSLPMDGSTKWLPIRELAVGPTDHISTRHFLCPLPGDRSFCWINATHSATTSQLNSKLATFTIFQLKNLELKDDDFSASSVTLEKLGEPGLTHTHKGDDFSASSVTLEKLGEPGLTHTQGR